MKHATWQPAVSSGELPSNHCHVWFWQLEEQAGWASLIENFSPEEVARATQLIFEDDRRKYILSHATMRSILGTYLHCSARDVRMSLGPFGKPTLVGGRQNIHFSLSHASSYAVLAIAHAPLGIDLEQCKEVESSVAEGYFSERERKQLAAYSGVDWTRCFFRCWTRKEAVLKAEGIGLTGNLQSFDIEIAHDEPPSLVRYGGKSGITQPWKIMDISPSHDVIIALALAPEIEEVKLQIFEGGILPRSVTMVTA